jgi:hypothetical protein
MKSEPGAVVEELEGTMMVAVGKLDREVALVPPIQLLLQAGE